MMGYGKPGKVFVPKKNELRPMNTDPNKTGDREVLKYCLPASTIFDFRKASPQYPPNSPSKATHLEETKRKSPRHSIQGPQRKELWS
jgi:hypothetical protein